MRDNLKKLADAGCPFVVRTPVVGGVNGNEEEVGNIARLIGGMEGLLYYQLVPYHKLGNPKLQSLGLPEEQGFHTPADERMRELAEVARKFVREVRP